MLENPSQAWARTRAHARIVVLISGTGSNLQAILDACASGELNAQVVAVISDKNQAYGLERARLARVLAIAKVKPKNQERRDYDAELADLVASYHPDWIALAGWMRILTSAFVDRFPNRIINLHPALPGAFPGTHAIERAYYAYCRNEIDHTGVMVHYVSDEQVDAGPALEVETVPIYAEDTVETLEARIHTVEHRLLVSVLKKLVSPSESARG
ncbi:MAG: phosphoribosylglycinamide formyltransferase [Anaerolineae bacterium]